MLYMSFFFFSSRRRHTRFKCDWSSDVCSSDLSDGNWLEVRDSTVGLVYAESGEFAALPTDEEIVFDDKLFIPPVGTMNRRIEGELGLYALDTGNGILLHGTPHKASIGAATTHGCIRLRDEDIQWLFEMAPLKARVYVY